MDKRIQTVNQSVSTTTEESFIKALFHVNYLTAYPLSDLTLEGWARSINELNPKITTEILKKIINKFKTGEYEYDRNKGIQNIFEGYRLYILSQPIDYGDFYGTKTY